MSTDLVDVFLGDLIEDDSEWHVLNRLRDDLTVRGIHARIFANFFTNRRRYQRQVDLLVVTAYRVTVIELKNYNPAFPLNGGLNGPWTQALPDGRVRQLDGNPIRQAGGCTFAVSDDMRALADRGDVPREDRFYRYLDSVVCVYPHVPAGSTIAAADHVTVVGYDELIDRLGRPGPRPRWEDRDWDRFARYVELHPFASMEAEPAETQQDHLRDYCRRFVRGHEHSLHELVPLAGRVDGQPVAALDVASAARLGRFVTVIGRSGTGKSHLARHTALDLARAGHFVVWARCDEYRPKRLSVLLARSVAPYTTADARSLIDTAARAGREAVLILDGLNETDGETQRVLLEQLASLRLRHRAGVVITSTEPVAPVDETTVSELETQLPSVEERRALLRSHGAARPDDHSEAFRTPFELSLAARCVRDLDADATRSSLFDAYILRRTGSLTIRTVLRQIARLMNEQMTGSLALARVLASLERSVDPAFSAQTIDAALASPLLDRTQGRVRFTHELFAQFLAADELVLRASSGTELGELLGDPRHRDLTDFAVDLEISPGRRHQLVRALGDDRLLREGLLGRYGSEMRSQLTADARALFADAIELTSTAWLDAPDAENPFTAQWCRRRLKTDPGVSAEF